MTKKLIFLLFMTIYFFSIFASDEIEGTSLSSILERSEEFVQNIAMGKLYLVPEKIQLESNTFFLDLPNQAPIIIPTLYEDNQGLFLVVNKATEYWQCCNWDCKRVYTSKPKKCYKCGSVYFRRWYPGM